jgi:hypothetical protein
VTVHPGPRIPQRLTDCELEVFSRSFGDTRRTLDLAYGPYLDQTLMAGVEVVDTGAVLGFARVIAPGQRLSRTMVDIAGPPWHLPAAQTAEHAGIDLTRTLDIATIGAVPGRHNLYARASLLVLHATIRFLQVNQAHALTAIIDRSAHRMLDAHGLMLRPLPGAHSAPYMGSRSSTPVQAIVDDLFAEQRRRNPKAHHLLTEGHVGHGVEMPDDDAFRWPVPQQISLTDGATPTATPQQRHPTGPRSWPSPTP